MSVIGKPRDERGAVAPFVAILIVVLVGLASFAVDLGYQRVAARDMQAVADIVAMDMARQLDGSTGNELKNRDLWRAAARASLARNDEATVGDELEEVPCNYDLSSLPVGKAVLCATPGIYNPDASNEEEKFGPGTGPATHVRVVTRTRVDYFFPMYADGGWVTKVAYATAQSRACFKLGSYAAGLNSNDSALLNPLLSGLLDSNVNLGLLGYQGLASSNVDLLDLVAVPRLGVGSVDELLSADIRLSEMYLAVADVLRRQGAPEVQLSALEALSAAVNLPNQLISLGDLIAVETAGSAAVDASLNVLDLVSGGAFVANGAGAVSLPGLAVLLPGVTDVAASLNIVEAPRQACGPVGTVAKTAQVSLALNGDLLKIDLPFPKIAIESSVAISVDLAQARARLTDIICGDAQGAATAEGFDLAVTSAVGSSVSVDLTLGVSADLSIPLLGGVKFDDLGATLRTAVQGDGIDRQSIEFRIPNDAYGRPKSTSSGTLLNPLGRTDVALSGEVTVRPLLWPVAPEYTASIQDSRVVEALEQTLDFILNRLITPVVNPLVATVNDLLYGPLKRLLGLEIAGVDAFALQPRPECGSPALRG